MKNILVTGGAGFIGSNLVLKLSSLGYNVRVIDNLSPQIHGYTPFKNSFLYNSIINRCEFLHGSVMDINLMTKSIVNIDAIVHLAAETGTGQSMYQIKKYTDTNIGGTSVLLDLLVNTNHNVKKVIVASSRSIYGEGRYWSDNLKKYVYPPKRDVSNMDMGDFEVKIDGSNEKLRLESTDENSHIHPTSVYGITKQCQEQLIMTVCPTINISPVSLRFQNVYGPGQSLSNPYTGILSIFSSLILDNKEINIFEDGKESRDFVYIDDVIDSIILSLQNDEANDEIFNVGSGVPTDVITVVENLIKIYNSNTSYFISGNYRLGDIRHNFADISKIQEKLGYEPKFTFEKGINNFAKWVKSQDNFNIKYNESLDEMKNKGLLK